MSWKDTLRKQDDVLTKQEQDRILKEVQDYLSRETTENMSRMQRDAHTEMSRLAAKAASMPDGPPGSAESKAKMRIFDKIMELKRDLEGPVGSSEF